MIKSLLRAAHQRAVLTVIVASVLATVCATTEQRPPTELRVASVDLVAAIEESPTTVGIADSNVMRLNDQAEVDKALDMIQALGVQNIRVGISWASSQLANGTILWNKTEYVINEAYRRGMGVLGVLHETPLWAGSPPLSGMPDPVKFGEFAGAVAEKYQGKISALEVWNEPNGKFFLNPVDPAGYTSLLKAAYTAIKAADPSITVVGGVLGSGRTVGDDFTMNPIDFLQGMYDAGAHGYFDAFSFHPYHYDIPFSEGETQSDSPILQLREIRALMQQFGDGALKVWATEYGLPTTPLDPAHPGLYNSPEKQADFLEDFLLNWQREEGTGPMFIYSNRDLNTGSTSDQDNFGVYYSDWTGKPAAKVIADFIKSLESGNPIIEAIKHAIDRVIDLTVNVINGVVDFTVWAVQSIVDATVWVVKTIANVTSKVVHGIADAIVNSVNWVVDKVKGFLGIESATAPQNRLAAARTAVETGESRPAEDDATEIRKPVATDRKIRSESDATEHETIPADELETTEPDLSEDATTAPEDPAASGTDLDAEKPEEKAEADPVTPRAGTTSDTRTVKTIDRKSSRVAATRRGD